MANLIMKSRDFLQVRYIWIPRLGKWGTNLINRNGVGEKYRQTSRYRSGRIRSRCWWAGMNTEWDTGEQIDVGVTWLGEWKSMRVSGGQVETIATVKALVCLTWPGCDWQILLFTESIWYCHLLCCLSVCPGWYDFDCWACAKMMWEMEKHVGGQILNRIDEAKVYLAANWMCSSAVAAFKNIPHDVLFYYLGH